MRATESELGEQRHWDSENHIWRSSPPVLHIDDELDELLADLNQDDDIPEPSATVSAATLADQAIAHASERTALESATADPAAKEAVTYRFPDTSARQIAFAGLTNDELLASMEALLKNRSQDGKLASYLSIRNEYCAISEVMNRNGLLPPRFRPARPLPVPIAGRKPSSDNTLMMLDRQVIDLHWLHCMGKRDRLEDAKEFVELFDGDEFDFDLAGLFAKKGWSPTSKSAKVLNLIEEEQWQMAFLRPKDMDGAWRNALTSMHTTIDRRLRECVAKEPGLKSHVGDWKLLWLADKLVRHLGQKAIGRMYGWLAGKEALAPATLSAKLKRMRRRTNPQGSRS